MKASPEHRVVSQAFTTLLPPLQRMGLLLPDEEATFTPLTGGVSSLIVRVDTPRQRFCLKRALPQLKVAALWEAPVKRNRDEVAWLRFAAQHLPHAVPALLGEDATDCVFAMAFLEPQAHPVWKNQLQAGVVSIDTAQQVAHCLAAWHGASAGQSVLSQAFDHDLDFIAIRLDPYFNATALRHPDCADALHGLVQQTLSHKHALVHGDVTRLLIDLEKDGDERWSRFSEKISESMRLRIVDRHERVYRQQLRQRIAEDLRRYESVVHLMVHTGPNHGGRVSLVTPEKSIMGESLAGQWGANLRAGDVDARCVCGADTGAFAMALARENDPVRYAQIRLEVSQNFFLEGKPLRWETIKKILLDALEQVAGKGL